MRYFVPSTCFTGTFLRRVGGSALELRNHVEDGHFVLFCPFQNGISEKCTWPFI